MSVLRLSNGDPRALRLCGAIALWLSLEGLLLGPASMIRHYDTADHTVPRDILLASAGYRASSHHWLPHMACGVDRLANDISHLHSTSLLGLALPIWAAYAVFHLLQYFLGAYYAYLLARERLRLSPWCSLAAGAAFCLSVPNDPGFRGGWLLLPFMAWQLEEIARGRRSQPLVWAAGLGLVNAMTSSVAMSLPFGLLGAALWLAAVRGLWTWKMAWVFAAFAAVSLLPHLQTAWAMALHASWSNRTSHGTPPLSRSLAEHLSWVFFPHRVVGLPLVFAALGARYGRVRWELLWALLVCALGGAALEGARIALSGAVPGVGGFMILQRLSFMGILFALLLTASGLDQLPRRGLVLALWALLLLGQSLVRKADNLRDWFFQGGFRANYSSPVLKELAARTPLPPFRVASFTHGLVPAYAMAHGLEAADGILNLFPAAYERFWDRVIDYNARSQARLDPEQRSEAFVPIGNRLYLFWPGDVRSLPGGVPIDAFARMNLLSLANVRYLISRHPLIHPDALEILGQRPWESMTRWERVRLRVRENFTGKTYFYLYENKTVLPRAYFVRAIQVFADRGSLLEAMAGAGPGALREAAYLEKASSGGVGRSLAAGAAEFTRYEPDRLDLATRMEGPGFLVVSNSYSPFWRCWADGREVEIVPAYGTFWGVSLDRPARTVAFRYRPPYRLGSSQGPEGP